MSCVYSELQPQIHWTMRSLCSEMSLGLKQFLYSFISQWKIKINNFNNQLIVIFQAETPNGHWFLLLKYQKMMLFFVI